ncbi:PepSY domain-containing protein [Sphingomonas elodea]|uniref:PepSY domain-containing protein n=1 Tax=Sphingomonas elodea TaxID=179878 RepID=UPI00026303BF|nr:PepSY domain-containing protein [Sphingomonas elodea]
MAARLLEALVWFHRWIGVATCLIFAAWFASGAVMLFQPFPSLPHAAQIELQAPIVPDADLVAPAPVAVAVPGAETLRLVQRAGRPAYVVEGDGVLRAMDARTGTPLPPLSSAQALAEARRIFGPGASAAGPFAYDQWVVHNRFDPARPFYRLDANDAQGTQLYLSARSGEVLQRTRRSERAWNWPGAVLHWVYVTPLRKDWRAWDASVWWLSLVCMLVAIAGMVLGIVRMLTARRLHPPRLTFFRGPWLRWHHLLGLGAGVFVLGWIVSGWLSMDHGRLFSRGMPTPAQAQAYAGCPLAQALRQVDATRLAGGAISEISVTALACRPVLTRFATDGSVERVDGAGRRIDDAAMRALVLRGIAASWPQASATSILPVDPDATYALAEGWPRSAWRIPSGAAGPDLYVDGNSGRLLTVMDSSRAAYAWVYYALHTGNVPGLVTRPALRRLLLLLPLAAGFLFSITGVVLGWRRLRVSASRSSDGRARGRARGAGGPAPHSQRPRR